MEEMNNDQGLVCVYCNKIFSNKHNLKVHKNTAKYCLKLHNEEQGLNNDVVINQCDSCKKTFTSKQTLLYHLKICKKVLALELKNYYEKYIHELEETKNQEIKELKERIKILENKIRDQRMFFV